MKKLGRKKKKNLDSMIELRVRKHLDKLDRRSIGDVRSPWLSADSASPDLRHNERAQSLPVDTSKAAIKEAELKKYRELHPGSELDRICEKQDNKAREKFGFAPKPLTKLFSKFEYENLIEERKEFLKSMNIQLEPDDYCKFTTKSGFIALRMIEEKQKLVKDIDFVEQNSKPTKRSSFLHFL